MMTTNHQDLSANDATLNHKLQKYKTLFLNSKAHIYFDGPKIIFHEVVNCLNKWSGDRYLGYGLGKVAPAGSG